ncbi:NAD(P)-dependent alcohol dehydrogenase [Rhodococcus wratislaviensis]|uniref:Putative aryl-alcohol dehydrogenase n=1 Tax=Rhodococcus wratislaviensis NBRC 100605 TaxID=1219028 RepID=X0PYS8_RHOWR|nr:NAD(P)-dependent alcohol dehydrogenase [Rhodococcus wratislaviensis]GAF43582.1 putative aryl-alcohol dehydrogenase [Rhodococcus wratislaviensis NBRC 100605]
MHIRAAVTEAPGRPFVLTDLDLDEPRDNEVLVRLVATGICQTDAHVWRQQIPAPLPIVLGHEGAGVVEKVGDAVEDLHPGDHVVLSYQSCGRCPQCLRGKPAYCDRAVAANFSGARLDGTCGLHRPDGSAVHGHFFGQSSFATHALVTSRNAVKIPDGAPLELVGPLGCGFQTGAGAVLNTFGVAAGDTVAILGVGAVGFGAVMAAAAAGASAIVAVDVNPRRLALAADMGATHIVDAREADVAQEIRRVKSRGVEHVLDTTGRADMLAHAVAALAPLGEVGLVAGGAPDAAITASALGLGLSVRGIVQGDAVPQLFIPQLVQMYQAGRFPIDRLVQHYAFDDIDAAFEAAARGDVVKPVLHIGETDSENRSTTDVR